MQLQLTNWKTNEEILEKLRAAADLLYEDSPLEIERKWIVDPRMIDELKTEIGDWKHKEQHQAYLSVDPEIRYRNSRNTKNNHIKHFIAHKSDGGLVREEIELEITIDSALKFAAVIRDNDNIKAYNGSKFIVKDYYIFYYGDIKLQLSIVDAPRSSDDHDESFAYMEIEFRDSRSAMEFEVPVFLREYIIEEVTDNPEYKMKNYWARTRLAK